MLRAQPIHFFASNKLWDGAGKKKDLLISSFYMSHTIYLYINISMNYQKSKKNSEIWKEKKILAPGLTLMKIFECFPPECWKLNSMFLLCIVFFSIKLSNSSVVSPGLISRGIFNIIKSKALSIHNHETKELEIDNGVFRCVDMSLCLIQ